jgi:hypothetical protein
MNIYNVHGQWTENLIMFYITIALYLYNIYYLNLEILKSLLNLFFNICKNFHLHEDNNNKYMNYNKLLHSIEIKKVYFSRNDLILKLVYNKNKKYY